VRSRLCTLVRPVGSQLGRQADSGNPLIRSRRRSVQTRPWDAAALSLWPGLSWCVRSGLCHWVPEWVPLTSIGLGFKPGLSFICLRHGTAFAGRASHDSSQDHRRAWRVGLYGYPAEPGFICGSLDRVDFRHGGLRQRVYGGPGCVSQAGDGLQAARRG
jgi:hypothetical protein